ncbi:low molecular weight phosphatase family protein [Candidatus Woesearchaeota archaeon]|nr:low molecular weight phosphatase family protein [Candidatus Woesearchaeota archaeon]
MTQKILFVCQGNSIRSIMAEAIFNHRCKEDCKSKSAGTLPITRIDPKTKKVLQEAEIPLVKQKPSPLTYEKIISSKKVVLMSKNLPNFPELTPKKLIIQWNIADPLGTPVQEFRKTRDKITRKVKELIKKLR